MGPETLFPILHEQKSKIPSSPSKHTRKKKAGAGAEEAQGEFSVSGVCECRVTGLGVSSLGLWDSGSVFHSTMLFVVFCLVSCVPFSLRFVPSADAAHQIVLSSLDSVINSLRSSLSRKERISETPSRK